MAASVAGAALAPPAAAQGNDSTRVAFHAQSRSDRSAPEHGAAAACGLVTAVDTHENTVTVHDVHARALVRVRLTNPHAPAALALRVGTEVVRCERGSTGGERTTAAPYVPDTPIVLHLRDGGVLPGRVVGVSAG